MECSTLAALQTSSPRTGCSAIVRCPERSFIWDMGRRSRSHVSSGSRIYDARETDSLERSVTCFGSEYGGRREAGRGKGEGIAADTTELGVTYKLLSLVVVLTVSARPGAGQQFDSTTSRMVAPGVVHRRVVVNRGPWHVNILEVNLRQPGVVVRGVRAHDSFVGRETVSSMAKRYNGPGKVVGAVNADFFNIRATGESENNVVIEGRLWKGVRITDSPYDAFNTIHSQFGLDSQNHPLIERFEFEGRALGPRNRTANLDALNFWPDSNALVLYTAAFGDSTPPDSTGRHLLVVPLRSNGRRGDTLIFVRAGKERQGWSLPLVAGGVLAAGGKRRSDLRALVAGVGAIKVVASLVPNRGRLRSVVGGWPRLIMHGRSVAA